MFIKSLFLNIFFLLIAAATGFSQKIVNGPYLAEPGEKTITIRWESDSAYDFELYFGVNGKTNKHKAAQLVKQKNDCFIYEATLTNLKPEKRYTYRISTENSNTHYFKISDTKEHLKFAVLGDSRSKSDIFSAIAAQINGFDPAVIIANGDIVAKGGNPQHWHSQFFEPSKNMTDHIPLITAVGDHESDSVDGDSAKLFTCYLFPHKDNMKLWFSYDIGNAHFVFLDWRYPENTEMQKWFEKDITSSDKMWKFVVMHRPPYNLGGHHVSWGKNIWPDLFQKHRIDVVFSGHSHLYERFFPVKPVLEESKEWAVTYITTGGAGASLYEANPAPALAFTKSTNHFLKVETDGNKINIKAVDTGSKTIDSVAWQKTGDGQDKNYLSKAFAKEELDIINVFNTPISERIDRIPMVHVPYSPSIKLNGSNIKEDVRFTIRLAKESEQNYKMKPVSGVIKKGTTIIIKPEIFGRTTMTVSKWGTLKPVLRLVADYKSESFSGSVKGVGLEYISY